MCRAEIGDCVDSLVVELKGLVEKMQSQYKDFLIVSPETMNVPGHPFPNLIRLCVNLRKELVAELQSENISERVTLLLLSKLVTRNRVSLQFHSKMKFWNEQV
ncbi:MAG: hypothetical protein ACE5HI_07630 [bacterium]